MARVRDLPIVFMSIDEPWADEYWADLLAKAPWAKRVHGVIGLDSCHKAALKAGGGEVVITVDADTLVRPSFFELDVPEAFLRPNCRVEWPSHNVVNGQVYGNGSLKCWPGKMIREMRTHELSPKGRVSIDHAVGAHLAAGTASPRVHIPEVHSDVNPALTPYHAFRCGFREGVRLSLGGGEGLHHRLNLHNLPERQIRRLVACCSVGADFENGHWLMYGTRLGVFMTQASDWDFTLINDYAWFDSFWNDLIALRFGQGGTVCRYTGFRWNPAQLGAELVALGQQLSAHFGLEVFNLSAAESRLFKATGPEPMDWWMSDSFGYMYLKGHGIYADHARARHLFDVGVLNNVAASYNNLARMAEAGQNGGVDTEAALSLYELAVQQGDRFAPHHMANLLRRLSPDDQFEDMRAETLDWLSVERGFDPNALVEKREATK